MSYLTEWKHKQKHVPCTAAQYNMTLITALLQISIAVTIWLDCSFASWAMEEVHTVQWWNCSFPDSLSLQSGTDLAQIHHHEGNGP